MPGPAQTVPGAPLLTKFYVPNLRTEHLLRPRLTRRLDEGLARKLTLVCAPAGYGKTTLVAEWVTGHTEAPPIRTPGLSEYGRAGRGMFPSPANAFPAHAYPANAGPPPGASLTGACRSFAWLSLEAGDSDPVRFLSYLIAALQQIDPTIGREVDPLLRSGIQGGAAPSHEVLLTPLINSLASVSFPFVLVLDDYHLITALAVHLQVAFLLEHQPPQMHMVIATRDDPQLPLAKWRARGQVVEIRQSDLQFTAEETLEFLRRTAQTELAAGGLAAVQQRTEGWAAGLELLAHSLRNCDDVQVLLESFTGSDRYVLDYLMEEVVQRQPAGIQDFLLKTSMLDRLSAPLCDVVTGRTDSAETLLALEQRNLFIVPLDRSREWYRYHHLFADLLRHRLALQAPDSVAQLRVRASRWYAEHGFPAEAVRHALAAHAWDEAAALISELTPSLMKRGEISTLLDWYQALPDSVIRSRIDLCAGISWLLILSGQVDRAEDYLAVAEGNAAGAELSVQTSALKGGIAAQRAYIARIRGDGRRAMMLSEQALALLPRDDVDTRGVIATNLGIAYWYAGNLDRAGPVLGEAVEMGRRSENQYAGLAAQLFLCRMEAAQGSLGQAAEGYRQIIRQGGDMPFVALAHSDLAKVLFDRNELAAAADHAAQAVASSRRSGQVDLQLAAARTRALIEQARGEQAAARQAVAEVEQLVERLDQSPFALGHALAYRILIALMAGDLGEARHLLGRAPPLSDAASVPDYLLLSLAQARLLLAQARQAEALELLESRDALLTRAGFTAARIDTRALQALAAPARGEALAFLAEALALAAPEGFVRPFVDAGYRLPSGQPMAALLREAASQDIEVASIGLRPFIGLLLSAMRDDAAHRLENRSPGVGVREIRSQPLVEPLSGRELEVLRLLISGSTNDEISRSLYVSANTVKAHLKSIYRKLDVNSRHEAAGKAGKLGLL